jgi:hypothetical protein
VQRNSVPSLGRRFNPHKEPKGRAAFPAKRRPSCQRHSEGGTLAYKTYANRTQMESAGWKFPGEFGKCRTCSGEIEWATSPKGKPIPMNPNSTIVHFSTCASAGNGKPQQARTTAPQSHTAPPEGDAGLLQESIVELTGAIRSLIRVLMDRPIADSIDIPE